MRNFAGIFYFKSCDIKVVKVKMTIIFCCILNFMATYTFTTRHLDEVTNMQIGIGTRRVVIKNNCSRMVCCVLENNKYK